LLSLHLTILLKPYRSLATKDWQVILVADLKTPKDWHCENVILLTVEEQKSLPFETVNLFPITTTPERIYLYAIMQGADLLYETDDDNIPYEFWPSFTPSSTMLKLK